MSSTSTRGGCPRLSQHKRCCHLHHRWERKAPPSLDQTTSGALDLPLVAAERHLPARAYRTPDSTQGYPSTPHMGVVLAYFCPSLGVASLPLGLNPPAAVRGAEGMPLGRGSLSWPASPGGSCRKGHLFSHRWMGQLPFQSCPWRPLGGLGGHHPAGYSCWPWRHPRDSWE